MIKYEIQNYLGEVERILTEEQLENELKDTHLNYFLHNPQPEYDLVTYFKDMKESDSSIDMDMFKIYKQIIEE